MTDDAAALIRALDLAPHPEGGWFRETWRAPAPAGGRGTATAILFLLEAGACSHWHRVDADELWCWHAGAALALSIADDEAGPATIRLGPDVLAGDVPQQRVPAHAWQAADAAAGWALVSCIVSPAFDFGGFAMAPADWEPPCR